MRKKAGSEQASRYSSQSASRLGAGLLRRAAALRAPVFAMSSSYTAENRPA
jgi:hypothetical protein